MSLLILVRKIKMSYEVTKWCLMKFTFSFCVGHNEIPRPICLKFWLENSGCRKLFWVSAKFWSKFQSKFSISFLFFEKILNSFILFIISTFYLVKLINFIIKFMLKWIKKLKIDELISRGKDEFINEWQIHWI